LNVVKKSNFVEKSVEKKGQKDFKYKTLFF